MHSSAKYIRYGSLMGGLLFFSAVSISAQGAGSNIQGKVLLPSGASISESVKVSLETIRGVKALAYTDNQGLFQFTKLGPAIYQVVVEANKDVFEIATATVEVFPNSPSYVTIVLKEKISLSALNRKDVVSALELNAGVPSQALKEFELASNAANQGKSDEAVIHLRKAIAFFPDYLMAHNDLGTQLLAQGKLDEAETEFRTGIRIDPKAFNPILNLGIVLVYKRRLAEAADALRQALTLQSNSASARLHLGMALMGQDDLDGAEKELKLAYNLGSTSFSVALFHLGQVYMNKGERALALQALEAYLREVPNAGKAAEARKLIGMLR
jgi:Flp pilus assembly protein TadD